jgi:hypothetical protein
MECGCEDWIILALGKGQWQDLLDMVMNLCLL